MVSSALPYAGGEKKLYRPGVESFLFRSVKKLAPLLDSIGRDSGPMSFVRRAIVKKIKKNVLWGRRPSCLEEEAWSRQ